MRTLLRFSIPPDTGNAAVKDGTLGKVLESTLQRLKPEAAYFTAVTGNRGGFIVFDLASQADIPSIAEPLFAAFNATVEFSPVMNVDDLKLGLSKLPPM